MCGLFAIGGKDQKNFKQVYSLKDTTLYSSTTTTTAQKSLMIAQFSSQVYALGDGQPITGLRAERFPAARGAEAKFIVVATTPTRIYQFVGGNF
jgi:hypothetical protein